MNTKVILLLSLFCVLVLTGCELITDYPIPTNNNQTIPQDYKVPTSTPSDLVMNKDQIIASVVNGWLKMSLSRIETNEENLTFYFQLENIGNTQVQNVLAPNGPDSVWVTFYPNTTRVGYVESKTGFCPSIPSEQVPNCNPLEVFVKIKKIESLTKMIITYSPKMWFNYVENPIFYLKTENGHFVSISKEDYFEVQLLRESNIPKITYAEIFSLTPDTNIKVCTQNFFNDELTTCLTVLARNKKDPKTCEFATNKDMELECKRRFLHSYSEQLKSLKNSGIDVLSICKELPEDNNKIGQHDNDCFYQIGYAGVVREACDFVKTDKRDQCYQLYEINKAD